MIAAQPDVPRRAVHVDADGYRVERDGVIAPDLQSLHRDGSTAVDRDHRAPTVRGEESGPVQHGPFVTVRADHEIVGRGAETDPLGIAATAQQHRATRRQPANRCGDRGERLLDGAGCAVLAIGGHHDGALRLRRVLVRGGRPRQQAPEARDGQHRRRGGSDPAQQVWSVRGPLIAGRAAHHPSSLWSGSAASACRPDRPRLDRCQHGWSYTETPLHPNCRGSLSGTERWIDDRISSRAVSAHGPLNRGDRSGLDEQLQ